MRMTVEQLHNGECLPFTPENTLVTYNGSYLMGVVAGDEEEGWLDIVDLDKYREMVEAGERVEEMPLRRVYGEVRFVNADTLNDESCDE